MAHFKCHHMSENVQSYHVIASIYRCFERIMKILLTAAPESGIAADLFLIEYDWAIDENVLMSHKRIVSTTFELRLYGNHLMRVEMA